MKSIRIVAIVSFHQVIYMNYNNNNNDLVNS